MPSEPDQNKPLWLEEVAARLTRSASRAGVATAVVVAILLVGALDGGVTLLAGFDFVATVFYIVPVAFAAWAMGARAGVGTACVAALVEAAVTWVAAPQRPRPWILGVSVALELLVFLGAAFTFARLRWHLEHERELSRVDPTTGIWNPRGFAEALQREVLRADRKTAPLSLVYLDVDSFKEVNDRRGHAAGDELLRGIGATLHVGLRAGDAAGRLGGDEFAVLLPDTTAEACRVVVTRLLDRLRSELLRDGFSNTFSVGIVTKEAPPFVGDELLRSADRAMYQVKNAGGDGVQFDVISARETGRVPSERRRS
jgi:diguanylate cyclase (GGDEF)-like protein